VPDPIFADPRLAPLYDIVDDDRSDLAAYVGIVDELAASTVLDVGCGTGTLACMLASHGIEVIGRDPGEASLDVARRRPGAERVRWIHGDASSAPRLDVDLAAMTGNVAQVFLSDAEWQGALGALARAVRDGGWLVFEVRDPARRAWEHWTKQETYREVVAAGVGKVETWIELLEVAEPLISFRHVYRFARERSVVTSESTLRFRDRDEIAASLDRVGFRTTAVRDAPDRPSLELVFSLRVNLRVSPGIPTSLRVEVRASLAI
jgi:SAM-dependent methyltransferase